MALNMRTTREEIVRKLARLVLARQNDAVKLAFMSEEELKTRLGKLDLSPLAELKRNQNGAVELKFVDRLAAAELLLREAAREGEPEAKEDLLSAINSMAERMPRGSDDR